jgi:hypothetical protein
MEKMRNAYKIVVRKPGRDYFGRPKYRWEDNIKTDLKEMEWEDVNWIRLTQDMAQWPALVNTVVHFRVP